MNDDAIRQRYRLDPAIDWLLDTDPSIRWQVMRDLIDTPPEQVAAERSRFGSEGWGARLLDQQHPDAQPDARVEESVAIVLARCQADGRWLLDLRHRNTLHEELAGVVGEPNRWITLRARRVLDWSARRGRA